VRASLAEQHVHHRPTISEMCRDRGDTTTKKARNERSPRTIARLSPHPHVISQWHTRVKHEELMLIARRAAAIVSRQR
jgi:hypothetical protein